MDYSKSNFINPSHSISVITIVVSKIEKIGKY